MIQIDALTVGPFQSNCYVVSCTETLDAIIVDCGDESERILQRVQRLKVNVVAVVNTHAHLDHVTGLHGVITSLGVPVWMHADEMPIYAAVPAQAAMFGLPVPETVEIDRFVTDGETISFGKLSAEIILAPGHSPGSVCLFFSRATPPRLIAGDVLFQGSVGRTDLPGGDWDTLMASLRDRIVPLPDATIVYPGHGPETTIGMEKLTNPFVAPLVG